MASEFATRFQEGFDYQAEAAGESVTAYPSSGASSTVTMVLDRQRYNEQFGNAGGTTVKVITGTMSTSELADLDGYTFGIDGARWRIVEQSEKDGVHSLLLQTTVRDNYRFEGQFAED